MEYAKSRSVAHTANNVKLTTIIHSVHIVHATKQALKLHAGSARDSALKKTMSTVNFRSDEHIRTTIRLNEVLSLR